MQGSARIDELRQKFHENPRRYFAPLANEYRKAGDPEQAIAICRAHLAQQPAHMSGHVVYGQALYDANRIDESRTVFEKALSLDPDNAIVLRQLGDIARQRGETAEAKHWYGRALDTDPNNPEIAAYIAELTEPLTESAESVAAVETSSRATADAPAPVAGSETSEQSADLIEETAADSTSTEPVKAEAVEPQAVEPEAVEPERVEAVSDTPAEVAVSAEPDAAEPDAAESDEAPAEPISSSDRGERSRRETPVATPIVPLADVAWRKTPPHEDSPFVTRTMAELYAKQGYRAAALDVYRQLSLIHPDDQDILARIRELSGQEESRDVAEVDSAPSPDEYSPPVSDVADVEPAPREASEPTSLADEAPVEVVAEPSSEPSQPAVEAVPAVDTSLADPSRVEELNAAAPPDWTEVSEEPVYTPSVPDVEPEPDAQPPAVERHFTEMELAPGDTWDTDAWGAGFSADESTDIELDIPDTPFVNLSSPVSEATPETAPPPSEPAPEAAAADAAAADAGIADAAPPESDAPTGTAAPTDWERAAAESESEAAAEAPVAGEERPSPGEEPAEREAPIANEVESAATQEYAAAPQEEQAEPAAVNEAVVAEEQGTAIPETPASIEEERASDSAVVAEDPSPAPMSANEDFVEAERFIAAEETSLAEVESESPDEPHLVAYSPQPPDDDELPHFEPKGPTVREFFATLGARRPPSAESAQAFTARAEVPSHDNPSDYPLAASAFADLFPDSTIAEEDTRAAFALSGAMSGTPAGPDNPSAAETKRNTPSAPSAPVDNNQESEEDIRRFREWLDGLAES